VPNASYYGVSRFYGEIEIAHYNETVKNNTKTHISSLHIDSKESKQLMFHTPDDRSYLCADVGAISLFATMNWDYDKAAPHDVQNTTVHATNVRFDAFRNVPPSVPKGYRDAMDCEYKPNDIVPIAVGVALACLVVAVLVAYMVGRRRNRQNGYQSV